MTVTVEDGKAVVRCRYEEKELVKAIGDYKFDRASKSWKFPLKKLIPIIDNLKIEYDEQTFAAYQKLREQRAALQEKINLADRIKSGEIFNDTRQLNDLMLQLGLHTVDLSKAMQHQIKAVLLGALFGSYALFMDTGTGKTYTAIKLIQTWGVPVLIIGPKKPIRNTWPSEVRKWSKLKYVDMWNKLHLFKPGNDIYLINYEGFKKLLKILDEEGRSISDVVQGIVVDESQKLKNNKSEITKSTIAMEPVLKHRVCLSGTPNPNNYMEFWGQMALINSELLGSNFYAFRNIYFTTVDSMGFIYKPKTGAEAAILDNVGRQAFSIRKEDCLDLPERMFIEEYVEMEPEQLKAYETMLHDNVLKFGQHTAISQNQLSEIMKLRQITSGFVITDRGVPVLISSAKTDALCELTEEIPADRQIIIWCQFHWEIEHISELLGGQAVPFYGGLNEKTQQANLKLWMDNKARILVGHPKSGGSGLNLQQCSYMIWFSLSYSQEEYSQACDRIYRKGQENKCTYYIMLAKRPDDEDKTAKKNMTIDSVIFQAVQKKQSVMHYCLDMLKG